MAKCFTRLKCWATPTARHILPKMRQARKCTQIGGSFAVQRMPRNTVSLAQRLTPASWPDRLAGCLYLAGDGRPRPGGKAAAGATRLLILQSPTHTDGSAASSLHAPLTRAGAVSALPSARGFQPSEGVCAAGIATAATSQLTTSLSRLELSASCGETDRGARREGGDVEATALESPNLPEERCSAPPNWEVQRVAYPLPILRKPQTAKARN